jgi:hypothetical protein
MLEHQCRVHVDEPQRDFVCHLTLPHVNNQVAALAKCTNARHGVHQLRLVFALLYPGGLHSRSIIMVSPNGTDVSRSLRRIVNQATGCSRMCRRSPEACVAWFVAIFAFRALRAARVSSPVDTGWLQDASAQVEIHGDDIA